MAKKSIRRGNGEGSIIKLSGKRRKPYAVRVTVGWTVEGKQKYKYVSYHEKISEANKALREYLVKPYDLYTKDVTVLDLFEEWRKSTKLSEITIKGYVSAFRQVEVLHNQKIRDIKIIDLEDAMEVLKPSMQTAYKNVMQHVYTQGIKNDIIDRNLADFIIPAQKPKGNRQPFTLEQIEQIKDFKHRYNDITIILLYTGLRITELLEIKKENVNLDLRYMIGGKKTKAGLNRVIPIHDDIFEIVKMHFEKSNKYLIENNGSPVNYYTFMHTYWMRLKEYLGTDHTPHCTRHTFITYADKHNLNQISVKKIVGHATGDITGDVYTHKNIQLLVDEINKLKYA